jgi:hypothetical protein
MSNKDSTVVRNGTPDSIYAGCGYNDHLIRWDLKLQQPQQKELDQIKSILSYTGISASFAIYSAHIDNAVATIINNKRYIIYDPSLLREQDKRSKTYWSSMSILAHEIGHHLSGHTLNLSPGDPDPREELEADRFSGFVLFKMGATLQQASFAMQALGSEKDTRYYPDKYKRLAAIKAGYEDAQKQRFDAAVPPPPEDDQDPEWGKGYQDTFTQMDLVAPEDREDERRIKPSHNFNTAPLEGIIIDVQKVDSVNLEDRVSYFNLDVTILITRNDNAGIDNDNRKKGAKITFHIYDYYYLCKACRSNFEALMVPGRKIRFKSYYFGYGAEDIYYVKKLER